MDAKIPSWHCSLALIYMTVALNVPPLLLVYRFRSSSSGLSTPNHDFLNSGGQSTIIDGPRLPVQIFSIGSYISSRCNISTLVRIFHTDCTCMELSAADLNRKQPWAQFSILAVCHQVSVFEAFSFICLLTMFFPWHGQLYWEHSHLLMEHCACGVSGVRLVSTMLNASEN